MAEETKGNRSDGRGGNRRRRYFKRRSGDKPEGAQGGVGQEGAQQVKGQQSGAPGAQQGNGQQKGGKGSYQGNKSPQTAASQSAGGQSAGAQSVAAQSAAAQSASASMESGRARGVRKRRRSRSRRGDLRTDAPISTERDVAYVAPKDVFVYTHVSRPSSQGYEFRSEHFSKHGHTLEDYTVDLSVIFDIPRPDFGAAVHAAFDDMEQRGDVATEARFQNWIEYADPEAFAAAQAAAAASAAIAAANEAANAALPTLSPLVASQNKTQQEVSQEPSAIEASPLPTDDEPLL